MTVDERDELDRLLKFAVSAGSLTASMFDRAKVLWEREIIEGRPGAPVNRFLGLDSTPPA